MSESIEFTPHSDKQAKAIFSEAPILLLGTGTQFGKTVVGGLRMKLKMHTYVERDDNFIITAPTYKIMVQSTLPAFLRLMDGYGKHDKKNDLFKMHEGGTCYFRTETDPDSIVGIPNVRHIWGDEAGKYRLYFWENIQARADATGCGVDLTTSPYSRNWVYKELVKPALLGKRPDVELIQAASWENPYHSLHDPEKRRLKRETMDARRFDMQYGGEWGQMAGLVYDSWDNEQNYIQEFKLPLGTKYFGGIDWGFTDPFVLKIRAVLPNGEHIGISEFYKTGQTISDIKEVCKKKQKIYDLQMIYCDPSQPGYIEELNRAGIPAVGADNDIRRGIDAHYELIKTRRYKEFIGACPYSADEREAYHYPEPEDLGPDDDSKEQLPVDANNHACLAGDTLVETQNGPKRIDEIVVGERVLTPLGYREVIGAGMTGIRDTILAKFSDNSSLEITADHPIYIAYKGFKKIDSKSLGAIVYSCENISFSESKTTAGMVSIGCQLADALTVAKDCTSLFGKALTGLYQKAITYTTKITTDAITIFQTLSVYPKSVTLDITPTISLTSTGESLLKTQTALDHSQKLGTEAPRVEHGTHSMAKTSLLGANQSRLFAVTVKNLLSRLVLTPNFARIIASRLIDARLALITLRRSAWSALKLLLKTDTQAKNHVRLSAIESYSKDKKVYNLTIKNAGCFYANGILVSNCDADRYLSLSLAASSEKRAPKVNDAKPKIHHDDVRRYFESLKKKRPGGGGRIMNDL